jgi:hypothetical protein
MFTLLSLRPSQKAAEPFAYSLRSSSRYQQIADANDETGELANGPRNSFRSLLKATTNN